MTVRTVYSTNNGMTGGPGGLNNHGSAIAIGAGTDGLYSVNIINEEIGRHLYAMVDRAELTAIRDAITVELQRQ